MLSQNLVHHGGTEISESLKFKFSRVLRVSVVKSIA